jgi:type IX secretion system PorP/SprF family membrane protein
MKKQFIAMMAATAACMAGIQAQQRPHYTQYILNQYILNPALSGIENYADIKISGRDQWVGLNGAPQTFYLTAHAPLGKEDYRTQATSFRVPGENPRGKAYWETYTAAEPHHGMGISIIHDKTGNFSRFTGNVSYAYHLGLNARTNLAAGFSAGISRIGYDASKAQFENPADPVLISNSGLINKIRPDLNAGLWLYSADYFVGISAQQIIPQKVQFTDDAAYGSQLVPHLFLTAGYRFLLNDDINAIPSVMVKYVEGSPTKPQPEFNLKLQYHDLFWLGGSYRYKDGYAAMGGLHVGNTFNVGYAYDFTRTPINTVSRRTHELVIGFIIGNKWSEACPRCW